MAASRATPAIVFILPNLTLLVVALAVEAVVGYPDGIFRIARHPVVWCGSLIAGLDRRFNRATSSNRVRRVAGVFAVVAIVAAAAIPAAAIQIVCALVLPGWVATILGGVLASTLLAQRSLHSHVAAVADGLEREGLDGGRRAVAMIVGRNPQSLDEAGVVRAAIESLAENFSDGVVAPAFWCACLGLPGIAAYKAINTADSMIGHRTPRHLMFGWAAARLDDVVNLPASRLAALWLVAAAALHPRADVPAALCAIWRDAGRHRSPNAGWPEAAMAGALGLRLAGPRVYGTDRVDDSWMGDGRADATVDDLRRALSVFRRACALQFVAVVAVASVL